MANKQIPPAAGNLLYSVMVQFVIEAKDAQEATLKSAEALAALTTCKEVYTRGLTIWPNQAEETLDL